MAKERVVIVGAGIVGCSIAAHCAPTTSVTVLDQSETVGSEASSQGVGMIRRLGEDPYERALARRSVERLRALPPDWEGQPLWRRTGALIALAHDPHHLHDAVAHLRAQGVTVERCEEVARVAPVLDGTHISRAWWMPDELIARPGALVRYFHHEASRRGVSFDLGQQVLGLEMTAGRCSGVVTASGVVHADRVVLATGAWSGQLAATAGLHRPLVPVRRSVFVCDAPGLTVDSHPWSWVDDVGVYIRPARDAWWVSGCEEVLDWPGRSVASTGEATAEQWGMVQAKLARWFPTLAGLKPRRSWTGLRTFAPDRRPVLGPDEEVEGLWWAAGLGGFGVTCGAGVGETLAAWMSGQNTPWLPRSAVSPNRFLARWWPVREDGSVLGSRITSAKVPPMG